MRRRVWFLAGLAASATLTPARIATAETYVAVAKRSGSSTVAAAVNDNVGEFAASFAHVAAPARKPGGNLAEQLAAPPPNVVIGNADGGLRGHLDTAPVLAPSRAVIEAPRMTLTLGTQTVREPAPRASIARAPTVPAMSVRAAHRLRIESLRASRSSDQIVAKVQSAYLTGLQRCHKNALADQAASKVTLMFTVDDQGAIKRPTVSAPGTGIEACVRLRMQSWRFPEAGQSTMVSLTLALQPKD
ncbi:MAG: hypothetical protein H0X17_11285 [Deltaproteobacteria bacterium]|nr:hypothetical protein [Deltaproteobacteria bacterium]